MSERYTKLFALPENLYCEKAPVIISAGALLKDNQTGKVLAQLKIKNITANRLKAAKVKIVPFDTVGDRLVEETEYQYLDLDVKRDDMFGQKMPIYLPDNTTRSIEVSVTSVVFSDNSIWNIEADNWTPLRLPRLLNKVYENSEMVKQYKIEYGKLCNFELTEDRDIWICSCGSVNKTNEDKCHKCGCELQALKNIEKLEEDCNKRLKLEKEQKALAAKRLAEEQLVIEQKTKRNVKVGVICMIAVVICFGSISIFTAVKDYRNSLESYNEALKLMETDNTSYKAYKIFEKLGSFKDSQERLKIIKMLEELDTSHVLPEEYYPIIIQNEKAKTFKAYEETLKSYESILTSEQNEIYKKIHLINSYKGTWKVVSGNCAIGYNSTLYEEYTVESFRIYLNYYKSSKDFFIHTVPVKNSTTVYKFGGEFVISGDSNEPLKNASSTDLKDKESYKISKINDNRITITRYKGKKAVDKLVLEKTSDTY